MPNKSLKKLIKELIDNPPECVGCGFCCLTSICAYGKVNTTNGIGGCTSLAYDGRRYICNNDDAMREMKGTGCCCALFNSWRLDTAFRGWVKDYK